MEKLKLFKSVDHDEIRKICRKYTVNSDESIDVDGHVDLSFKSLQELLIKFTNVSSYFSCSNNQLTSLEGCPENVGGDFYCMSNQLDNLKGCPKSIGGDFYCLRNNIMSFEYFPEHVGRNIYLGDNPIQAIWDLFRDIKHIDLFNDMDIIREDKTLILDRLNDFLQIIGKPTVTSIKGWRCI